MSLYTLTPNLSTLPPIQPYQNHIQILKIQQNLHQRHKIQSAPYIVFPKMIQRTQAQTTKMSKLPRPSKTNLFLFMLHRLHTDLIETICSFLTPLDIESLILYNENTKADYDSNWHTSTYKGLRKGTFVDLSKQLRHIFNFTINQYFCCSVAERLRNMRVIDSEFFPSAPQVTLPSSLTKERLFQVHMTVGFEGFEHRNQNENENENERRKLKSGDDNGDDDGDVASKCNVSSISIINNGQSTFATMKSMEEINIQGAEHGPTFMFEDGVYDANLLKPQLHIPSAKEIESFFFELRMKNNDYRQDVLRQDVLLKKSKNLKELKELTSFASSSSSSSSSSAPYCSLDCVECAWLQREKVNPTVNPTSNQDFKRDCNNNFSLLKKPNSTKLKPNLKPNQKQIKGVGKKTSTKENFIDDIAKSSLDLHLQPDEMVIIVTLCFLSVNNRYKNRLVLTKEKWTDIFNDRYLSNDYYQHHEHHQHHQQNLHNNHNNHANHTRGDLFTNEKFICIQVEDVFQRIMKVRFACKRKLPKIETKRERQKNERMLRAKNRSQRQ